VNDEAARAAAREILAQPEFTRWHGEFESWLRSFERLIELIPQWLIDVLGWLNRHVIEGILLELGRFLGRLFSLVGQPPSVLGWLALGLLLAAAIVLGYRLFGSRWHQTHAADATASPGRTHLDAIREARELAGQGSYLEAAHRVQLATLALLIESDWLELARSDPNRTLRRRMQDSALPVAERRTLIGLVDRLEALWFDEPHEDRALYEDWVALDERILQLATGAVG